MAMATLINTWMCPLRPGQLILIEDMNISTGHFDDDRTTEDEVRTESTSGYQEKY